MFKKLLVSASLMVLGACTSTPQSKGDCSEYAKANELRAQSEAEEVMAEGQPDGGAAFFRFDFSKSELVEVLWFTGPEMYAQTISHVPAYLSLKEEGTCTFRGKEFKIYHGTRNDQNKSNIDPQKLNYKGKL